MNTPGYAAELSLGGTLVACHAPLPSIYMEDAEVIPALPVEGGMGCLALALDCRNCLQHSKWQNCPACQSLATCYPKGVGGSGVGPDPFCIAQCGGDSTCMDMFC
jgi:hypothetical protein